MKKLLAVLVLGLLLAVTACDKIGIWTPVPSPEPEASATAPAADTLAPTAAPDATHTAPATAPVEAATATQAAASPTVPPSPIPPTATALPTEPPPTPTMPPLADIPAFQGLVILYHVEGGIAGLCQDLALFQDGAALYGPCGRLAQGALDEAKAAQVQAWQKELASFSFRFDDNPRGPDNMTTTLVFTGQGTTAATADQQQALVDWAREAFAELAGQSGAPDRHIAITEPAPGAAISSPLLVTGEGMGFENQLGVQVLDEEGKLIGQTVAFITAELGKRGPFSAEITFTQPAREQAGRVVVFDTSPRDGSIVTLNSVEVRLAAQGEMGEQALIVAPGLRLFQGPGFSLPYVADTVVETAGDNVWKLAGRAVEIRPADANWTWSGPAYTLDIALYPNTKEATSEEWARERLAVEWKKAKDNNEPFTGPVDESGKIVEDKLALVRLGDKSALQADWFGGDSVRRVVYLSLRTRMATLAYNVYPVENYPLAEAASDVMGLLLAQVSAPEAQGVPNTVPLVEGVTSFMGPGFQLLVPAHATVEDVEPDHWQLLGPEVSVRAASGDAAWSGPAYQADLLLADNPDGLSAAEWAERVIQDEWKKAQDDKKPFTGPLDADGKLIAGRVAELMVGDVMGYQVDWLGENSLHRVLYVPAADKMLAVHVDLCAQEANPAAPLSNAAHALLLAGLRVGAAQSAGE